MTVHQKLHLLRLQKNLSLQALAEKIGTTKSQIDKLEKGDRRLTIEWLQKLCEALDVTPATLFEGEEEYDTATLMLQNPPYPQLANAPYLTSIAEPPPSFPTTPPARGGGSYPLLPVYGQMDALSDELRNFSKPTSHTPAPPALASSAKAFALYVVDSSMEPRFSVGDMVFVNPEKPLTPHCYVLIIRDNDVGVIRQFLHKKNGVVWYRSLVETAENSIPFSGIKNIYRIVGSYEGGF
jgi:transcriptional regulator with XRE-family HTH domain